MDKVEVTAQALYASNLAILRMLAWYNHSPNTTSWKRPTRKHKKQKEVQRLPADPRKMKSLSVRGGERKMLVTNPSPKKSLQSNNCPPRLHFYPEYFFLS